MIDLSAYSKSLRLDQEGIWCATAAEEISYPSCGHDACIGVEDQSFWFRHRNECIAAAVHRYGPPHGGLIFDIGGGNGYVARGLLKEGFDVVVVEPGRSGARNARQRGLPAVVCATTESARFVPQSLPAVGLFDVIEHIERDGDFLRSIGELLVSGGRVYATVPSYEVLWSGEDVFAGHFRRYTQSEIAKVFESAGYEVEFSTYFFRLLPLPILLLRALPYRFGLRSGGSPGRVVRREHVVRKGVIAAAVRLMLAGEVAAIRRGRRMSFGASCLIVARLGRGSA